MKIKEITETATAGGTGAGSVAAISKPLGAVQRRNMYNSDGTMKNGLDQDNLFGAKTKKKKRSNR